MSASLKGCDWFFPFNEAHFSAYLLQRCELIAHVVGRQGHLRRLDLSNLGLTVLDPELGQLSHLQWLDLGNNQLTQLPVELAQLSHLWWLSLYSKQLTQVPAELGQLSQLQQIGLAHNPNLQIPPPEVIAGESEAILAYLRKLQK